MTWTTTLVQRLRYYIGDIVVPYKYSDSDLEFYVAMGGIAAASKCQLGVDFTIDTSVPSIDPDPIDLDIGIGNLFVLFAACILSRSEIRRDISKYGIKIKDDLTQYDGTAALEFRGETLKAFNAELENACWNWDLNNRAAVRAVFGAAVGNEEVSPTSFLEDPQGKR